MKVCDESVVQQTTPGAASVELRWNRRWKSTAIRRALLSVVLLRERPPVLARFHGILRSEQTLLKKAQILVGQFVPWRPAITVSRQLQGTT